VDGIDRLGRLLTVIRRGVSDVAKRGASRQPAGPGGSRLEPASLESLRDDVVRRLRALPTEPGALDAEAPRIFVESVLAWEFGEELLADPAVDRVIERVGTHIASDKGLRRQLREVLEDLATRG